MARGSGWKHSKEVKEKMSRSHIGKKFSEETRLKMSKVRIGRKPSKETLERTSKAMKERMRLFGNSCGYKVTEEIRRKISESNKGSRNSQWKGGVSLERKRIRASLDFHLWREAVFERDNWTCQATGVRGGELHPHHLQNFSQYPELRFAIDNGITLSKEAHKEFHKIYGYRNNTREQMEEYLNSKNCTDEKE